MKSNLFKKFDLEHVQNKDFVSDLKRLITLSDKSLSECINALSEIVSARTNVLTKTRISKLIEKIPDRPVVIVSAITVLEFFAKYFLEKEGRSESNQNLIDDLVFLKILEDEKQVSTIGIVLKRLREKVVPEIEEYLENKRILSGVLPVFSGIGVTVELRPVEPEEDAYDSSKNVKKFINEQPSISRFVAIASVSLKDDVGENGRYHFQADKGGLETIIKYFQAAIARMEYLEQNVSINP